LPLDPGFGVTQGSVAIPFDPNVSLTSVQVAALVLSVINSPAVQSQIRVVAFPVSGLGGQPSDAILISGATGVSIPSAVGNVLTTNLEGDRNTSRDQGQVLIENSRISFSSGFGVVMTADVRDPVSGAPNPGSVRNTLTINNQRLIPGAVMVNNELISNIGGGIDLGGDPLNGPNDVPASVPFARIVNNTIFGGSGADQYRSRACKFQATPSEPQITAVSVSRFQAKVPCRSVAVVCWSSSSPTTS
jgi:hypothetical protein